jgi:F0F1-type ATP synthase assembly protein I
MGRLPLAIGLIGIGWYFAASIVVGVVVGLVLDEVFDLKPLFTMLGLFVGLAAAGYGGYKMVMDLVIKRRSRGGKDLGQT